MNNLAERMKSAGAVFIPNGNGLLIRAPRPLPPDLAADLRAVRGDLLDVYNERAGIREFDGDMPRAEAEAAAAGDVSVWLAGHSGAPLGPSNGRSDCTPYVEPRTKPFDTGKH